MRTVEIQCAVFMMMVAVSVYSIPVHTSTKDPNFILRKEIQKVASDVQKITQKALNVSREEFEMMSKPKIPQHGIKCMPHFFCLAEKALQELTNTTLRSSELERLHRFLIQYNNKTQDTHCELKLADSNPLWYLKVMNMCVDYLNVM